MACATAGLRSAVLSMSRSNRAEQDRISYLQIAVDQGVVVYRFDIGVSKDDAND